MTLPEVGATTGLIPPLAWAVVRMIVALALLGAASWVLLRWKKRSAEGLAALRVLDRACLTRGASLALVSVAGKRLLLGISSDGVRLLSDLEPHAPSVSPAAFDVALDQAVESDEAVQ